MNGGDHGNGERIYLSGICSIMSGNYAIISKTSINGWVISEQFNVVFKLGDYISMSWNEFN